MRRRTAALLVVGAVAAAGGTGFGVTTLVTGGPTEREASRAATDRDCVPPYVELEASELDKPALSMDLVGTVDQPAALAIDPRGDAPTLLGEREGRVRVVDIDDRTGDASIGDVVLDLDDTSDHGDGGLLALAYDPDGAWLYALRTDADQDDVVTAYPLGADGLPDADGEVELLRSGHGSSEQHHGGGFAFGPDGFLYIGFGDGGGLGDPNGNAQDGGELLGKLLRIDPTPGDASSPYAVPPDNPFVDRDGWRPEIWAYGVRNPYRLSFDGDVLWLGDVGQSCVDEIDRLVVPDDAGANLGWDRFEGTTRFQDGGLGAPHHLPELTWSHLRGWCALVAGYVVHDPSTPELDGALLHTDYCKGRIYTYRPGRPGELVDTGLRVERPIAVAPGPDGLPWVLSLDGQLYRIEPRRSAG